MTRFAGESRPTLILAASDYSRRHRIALYGDEITIGRDPDDGVFLADLTVSPHHATLHRTPEGYMLTDGGSLTGTYVNGARVEHRLLSDGDEVRIGRYRLAYQAAKTSRGGP